MCLYAKTEMLVAPSFLNFLLSSFEQESKIFTGWFPYQTLSDKYNYTIKTALI